MDTKCEQAGAKLVRAKSSIFNALLLLPFFFSINARRSSSPSTFKNVCCTSADVRSAHKASTVLSSTSSSSSLPGSFFLYLDRKRSSSSIFFSSTIVFLFSSPACTKMARSSLAYTLFWSNSAWLIRRSSCSITFPSLPIPGASEGALSSMLSITEKRLYTACLSTTSSSPPPSPSFAFFSIASLSALSKRDRVVRRVSAIPLSPRLLSKREGMGCSNSFSGRC
mmetsp:Transcript_35188/g.91294  ORF Transcript_35188/g.91294 Transcript_35188/m.91294 type:complete len:224 (+) Transcript_35188:2291-2962(+)